MRRLVLFVLAALIAAAFAQPAGAVVPAKTVKSADGLFIVKIPRGALAKPTKITVRLLKRSEWPKELRDAEGSSGVKIYRVKPDGLRLRKPATLTRRFPSFDLSAGMPGMWFVRRTARGRSSLVQQVTVLREKQVLVVRGKTRKFSDFVAVDGGGRVDIQPKHVETFKGQDWGADLVWTRNVSWEVKKTIATKAVEALDDAAGTRSDATLLGFLTVFKCNDKAAGSGTFGWLLEMTASELTEFVILIFGDAQAAGQEVTLTGTARCKDGSAPPSASANSPPDASFTFSPNSPPSGPKADELIEFRAVATDSDGSIVSWRFDWGDGSSDSGIGNPTAGLFGIIRKYSAPGIYNATLTVTDDRGATFRTPPQEVKVSGPGSVTQAFSFPCPNGGGISGHPIDLLIPSYAENPRHTINNPICSGANPQVVTAERIIGNESGALDAWKQPKDTYRLRISVNGTTTTPNSATPTVSWD